MLRSSSRTTAGSVGEERIELRIRIIQSLRTVFSEIVFSPHAVAGLIELPGKPKSMKGPLGLPKPIVTRIEKKKDEEKEMYFHRHEIFNDHPEVVAAYSDGKSGILSGRIVGGV